MVERDTFTHRFNKLLDKVKTDELTLEEISEQVESVRGKRQGVTD
jgi:uncharacterized protein YnzC (UPF0291/DUF896 family)